MIEKILEIKGNTDFDFREFVHPDDELSYLFDDWVDYYRLKYAISKAIAPKSILELGVRYGYSAITFLSASKDASYLGIDNDSESFGGASGAAKWAEKITEGYDASFLNVDTQSLDTFPGDYYDLIHVDAQQDGDGTFRDLMLALEKGRYILVDGLFWSRDNMLSSTFFLEKYNNMIEYALVIPGYAGELLIKTKPESKDIFSGRENAYSVLDKSYDSDYYLKDCGGYEAFLKSGGVEIDERLVHVFCLARPVEGQRILDIGCGRGELTYAMAAAGAEVTGLDYSADAIKIAKETFAGQLSEKLSFVEGDIMEMELGEFDSIVAADFVEHVEGDALSRILSKISKMLRPGGRLIVHTAPNKLHYTYNYAEKRRRARELGLYLPENPRSYYEDLMHLNEQTPARLKRTLGEHFDNTLVWVPSGGPQGSLVKSLTREELAASTSIFAVASSSSLDKAEIASLVGQERLSTEGLALTLETDLESLKMSPSEIRTVTVSLENNSGERVVSLLPFPVNIAYHWLCAETGGVEVFDGIRTPIKMPLSPSERRRFQVQVKAPERAGDYRLQLTLVQESHCWLEDVVEGLPLEVMVCVG